MAGPARGSSLQVKATASLRVADVPEDAVVANEDSFDVGAALVKWTRRRGRGGSAGKKP